MRRAIAIVDRLFTLAMIVLGSALVGAGTGSALLGFGAFFLTLAAAARRLPSP